LELTQTESEKEHKPLRRWIWRSVLLLLVILFVAVAVPIMQNGRAI